MSHPHVTMLLEFFRPMLMALFEYYLYETYSSSRKQQLKESTLPYSAIEKFYNDFASSDSSRLNSTTLHETLRSTIGIDRQHNLIISDSKKKFS
jgi:hypothetical protein